MFINAKDDNSLKPNQHLGVHTHFFEKLIFSQASQFKNSGLKPGWQTLDRIQKSVTVK